MNIHDPGMIACSDALNTAVKALVLEHDSRYLFACLVSEAAHIGALLREAGVYRTDVVIRAFAEGLTIAATLKSDTPPKILYTDGTDTGSKQ